MFSVTPDKRYSRVPLNPRALLAAHSWPRFPQLTVNPRDHFTPSIIDRLRKYSWERLVGEERDQADSTVATSVNSIAAKSFFNHSMPICASVLQSLFAQRVRPELPRYPALTAVFHGRVPQAKQSFPWDVFSPKAQTDLVRDLLHSLTTGGDKLLLNSQTYPSRFAVQIEQDSMVLHGHLPVELKTSAVARETPRKNTQPKLSKTGQALWFDITHLCRLNPQWVTNWWFFTVMMGRYWFMQIQWRFAQARHQTNSAVLFIKPPSLVAGMLSSYGGAFLAVRANPLASAADELNHLPQMPRVCLKDRQSLISLLSPLKENSSEKAYLQQELNAKIPEETRLGKITQIQLEHRSAQSILSLHCADKAMVRLTKPTGLPVLQLQAQTSLAVFAGDYQQKVKAASKETAKLSALAIYAAQKIAYRSQRLNQLSFADTIKQLPLKISASDDTPTQRQYAQHLKEELMALGFVKAWVDEPGHQPPVASIHAMQSAKSLFPSALPGCRGKLSSNCHEVSLAKRARFMAD